jgi:hypothetical protein
MHMDLPPLNSMQPAEAFQYTEAATDIQLNFYQVHQATTADEGGR